MSQSQAINHHVLGEFNLFVKAYCGATRWTEHIPAEWFGPKEQPPLTAGRHCIRCLFSKQRDKGLEYMQANRYPKVIRERWGSSGAGRYIVEGDNQ